MNSGVGIDSYLGTEFVFTYPSVDNITDEVLKLVKRCQMFKVDISRPFRHVPIDPGDLDLFGITTFSIFRCRLGTNMARPCSREFWTHYASL